MKPKPINNRVTEMTGVDYPILQAPMGWIARAQLASAVSNSGAMGIIETSSGEFDARSGRLAPCLALGMNGKGNHVPKSKKPPSHHDLRAFLFWLRR